MPAKNMFIIFLYVFKSPAVIGTRANKGHVPLASADFRGGGRLLDEPRESV